MKAHNNHSVSVLKPYLIALVCLLIGLHLELKSLLSLSFFFFNWGFQIGGAAYLWVLFIQGPLRYISPQGSFPGKRYNSFCFIKT